LILSNTLEHLWARQGGQYYGNRAVDNFRERSCGEWLIPVGEKGALHFGDDGNIGADKTFLLGAMVH